MSLRVATEERIEKYLSAQSVLDTPREKPGYSN
jgi:hypothetical protein